MARHRESVDHESNEPQLLDTRLLPATLVCWGATILAVTMGWQAGVALALALGGSAIIVGAWLLRSGQPLSDARRVVAAAALGAMLLGTGFAVAASWQAFRAQAHPLRTAAPGTYLTAIIVASDDPKPMPAKPFGARQWMVRATLREYRHSASPVRSGGAVLVLAPENGWRTVLPGQQVEFRARLDRPWRRDLTVAVLRAQGPPRTVGSPPWWQRAAGTVRARFAAASARVLPADAAGLLPGLVDGDISRLPDQVRENFQQTDLTHLVAVSGTNVTIILAGAMLSVRALTLDHRLGVALAALALVMFVILARPSPTVLRAAIMGAIALLGAVTGRRKQALPALCAAVIGLIGFSPALALDIGFALSVLATAALILLAPGWSQWLEAHGWHRLPAESFAVASAAFLFTAPMLAALTGHVGLLAILANMLVEPMIAPITMLGAIGAILSCLWTPAAELVLRLTALPLRWLLFVSERGASLGISIPVPKGTTGAACTAAVVVVIIAAFGRAARTPATEDPGTDKISSPARQNSSN